MSLGRIYVPLLANYSNLELLLESAVIPMFLSALEVFLIVVVLLLELYNVYLFQAKNIFHINIKLCLYYYYLIDFLMSVVRIVFIVISVMDMVTPLWIEIITSSRVFYLLATASGMPVFLMERSFATYFSSDYQQKTRIYIPFFCTLLLNLINFSVNIYWLLTGNVMSTLIVSAVLSAIGLTGYLFLVRYNSSRLKNMFNNRRRYNFGSRYQIDENLRMFKVLRNAFMIFSGHALLFLITVLIPLLSPSPVLQELFHFFMEIVLSTLPAPIFICFIMSYFTWKEDFLRLFCCQNNKTGMRKVVVKLPSNQHEQDAYFAQLANTWK